MNIDDIRKIALQYLEGGKIESDCLEYKKSHLQRDSILKTMCAFSNNLMNRDLCMILIGVEEHKEPDLKGTPVRPICGYDESQIETIENSLKSLLGFIKPKISYSLTHAEIDGRSFVIFAFLNNNNGPFEVLEKAENDKSVNLRRGRYVRIERDSRLATIREEFELLKKFSNYHFTEEYSNVGTLDDLDVDYLHEFLRSTSTRNNTSSLSKKEISQHMGLLDENTGMVKNYALLMFSHNPEKFIPYAYIELIHKSSSGESVMSSKEYRGPIWKQLRNCMDDINNNYLRSLTLRVKDDLKSETIYNYPYSTIEELLTNAVVHKNYENPRTVQIYIYEDRIVITNYNKPTPPITIEDLNAKDSFPNRVYENPSIREMFKSLNLIESFGSGVGKAKRAMAENGSEMIHYEEYDERIDITSVTIPINRRYVQYSSESKKYGLNIRNLDYEGQNLDDSFNDLDDENQEKIKVNRIDTIGIINHSDYSNTIKKMLFRIYDSFFSETFGRSDIAEKLDVSKSSSSNYISYLMILNLIVPVKGKGKYRFR
jgi:predicted HTH transcriptional regulator